MDFGVLMFPADYAVAPDELARMVEERGFESLFFPERTHIPVSRRTPFVGGGELPDYYSHYDRAGVTRCILFVPPVERDEAEARLDRLAEVAAGYRRSE
ncbi:MAG TPA: hypothetical protein VH391_06605 [Solirubrobacterales bacterium]